MLTLSHGFEKPETGDKGSVFFPALENNIQKLNDHTHNGTNSELLTAASSAAVTQTINSASWSHLGSGTYRQLVTMPANIAFDTHSIQLRNNSTGVVMYLGIEKVSANTYYVFINDNSVTLKAVYT